MKINLKLKGFKYCSLNDKVYIIINGFNMIKRGFDFLRKKYFEVLAPNLILEVSDKFGTVLDVIIVGSLIGSSQLPALNVVSPFFLISAIIYALYGQGGSLLAIKARSNLNSVEANRYFTFSIVGSLLSGIIYMIFLFIFADSLLHLLNVPSYLFNSSKIYLLIISGFYTLNIYIRVMSYFLKADGQAKTALYAVLIANILNLILDFLLFNLFEQKIVAMALALVIGYLISAIYISKYLFNKDATFHLSSKNKITLKNLYKFRIKALKQTPDLIGRVLIVIKTSVIIYLCATFLGGTGLLAFLVYDNIETIIYLFVSGMNKTISPFLTLFYNEQDYPSVEYITKLATKHILILIITIGGTFMIFPEILYTLFNITTYSEQQIISMTIRITSIGLIGRCISMLIADYAQAISSSRISAIINFLREGVFPLIFFIILIPMFKGVGIWFALTLADTMPLLAYLVIRLTKIKKYTTLKNCILMIPESLSFNWTSIRGNFEEMDKNMEDSNKEIIRSIKGLFEDDYLIITGALEDIAKNLFNTTKTIKEIDISVIVYDGYIIFRFIYDGKKYDPFKNKILLKQRKITNLNKMKHYFDYYRMFDMNFSYIKVFKD